MRQVIGAQPTTKRAVFQLEVFGENGMSFKTEFMKFHDIVVCHRQLTAARFMVIIRQQPPMRSVQYDDPISIATRTRNK
jgi:hypothetical protein